MADYEPRYEKPKPKPYHGSTADSPGALIPEPPPARPPKKRKGLAVLLVILILLLALGMGYAGAAIYSAVHESSSGGGGSASGGDGYTLEDATGSAKTVSEVAEANADAVVEIATESVSTDSWFGDYVTEGAGSGVIISEDGYIMTNNHVVSGARSVSVTLHNGDSYDADVVGVDSANDVAVIKIKAKDLTSVTYGNSDQLKVGEMTVAIGNPLGELGGTVTAGILSATDRNINVDGEEMRLLQTDASINPGNSGGGLFNQYGQLIGLVAAKSSGSDVEGLGFAIPVNTAAEAAQKIIDSGGDVNPKTGKALIGLTVAEITSDEEAEQYGLKDGAGVYITAITSNNAQKAGLQIYDKITALGKYKVSSNDELQKALGKYAPGDKTKVTVVRDGRKLTLTTVLVDESEVMEQDQGQEQLPFGFDELP